MNTFKLQLILTALIAFISVFNKATAQSAQTASEYLKPINEEYEVISKELWDYVKSVAKGKGAKKVDKRRVELISSIEAARKRFQSMPGFKGDTRFKNALVANLQLRGIVLREEYGKIMDLEEIAEQSYDNMEAYLLAKERAGFKLDSAEEVLEKEQEIFAQAHNINFVDQTSKRSEKIKKASAAISYYNDIYLIFFKSYKQEVYMLDALVNNDVSGFEQNRQALASTAEEGLAKLLETDGYNNDKSLKYLCHKILDFYHNEAKNKMSTASDFFLKKENMEKMNAAFEAKRKNDRTQADVDKVNDAINAYNTSLNNYNKTNESLNKMRSDLFDQWNKSADKFLSQHAI